VQGLNARGILANPTGPNSIRFVTHYEVREHDVDKVLKACAEIL